MLLTSGCEQIGSTIASSLRYDNDSLKKLYEEYKDSSVISIKASAYFTTVTTGGLALGIPGVHLVGSVIDFFVLKHYLSHASYAIGASRLSSAGCGNILEPEDMDNIITLISTTDEVIAAATTLTATVKAGQVLARDPFTASNFWVKIAQLAQTSNLHTTMFAHVGALSAIGFKGISTSLAGKYVAKLGAGIVPVVGAVVAAGINWFIVGEFMKSADEYYTIKGMHCKKSS